MEILKLGPESTRTLALLLETGMGFQLCSASSILGDAAWWLGLAGGGEAFGVAARADVFPGGPSARPVRALPLAPSGFAAVGRYALPNVEPAMYVYEIEPRPETRIEFGTVAPAYGQAGGGVEVL